MTKIVRNPSREIAIGSVKIGGKNPIMIQSMCATRTIDIEKTANQAESLRKAGAGVVRIAIDTEKDVEAFREIRKKTSANISIDLQENYLLASKIAPFVQKIRYNPGHLHHRETSKSIPEKVSFLIETARANDTAIRVGVNCGSVAPDFLEKFPDREQAMVESALYHCSLMDQFGFQRYCVSLKDSDPERVVKVNRTFAKKRPDVPLHLGVTEAGMPPDGIIKTRIALEQIISQGIGDTLRVSLTVPNEKKPLEISEGKKIIEDIYAGRFRSVPEFFGKGLNIISCPSCSRVENEAFVNLAQEAKKFTKYAAKHNITIAIMGCRVNGPGETDHADLGLWCGPNKVNLKKKETLLGSYSYGEILPKLKEALDELIHQTIPSH